MDSNREADLGKAVISSDDKAVKEAQSKLIKRCIYAILVFFIVTLLNLLFTMVGNTADSVKLCAIEESLKDYFSELINESGSGFFSIACTDLSINIINYLNGISVWAAFPFLPDVLVNILEMGRV